MAKAKLIEKIGYGFGDMATSTFWKVFSYYLPIFYSNIFGLSLIDAGVLVLVTRIWDAVSDPMMGVIADRTNTKRQADVGVYDLYLDDDRLYVCERALRSDAGCDD